MLKTCLNITYQNFVRNKAFSITDYDDRQLKKNRPFSLIITAEQRIKEIGVRKVLGASVFNLWGLLSKDFVILVVISLFIAVPASYYFFNNWLQHYEYRTTIPWWAFAVTGAGAILITLLTVSFQSISAALANPVKSLRSE
jgi:ABC-type antimicrobial peptide transport system permease subunit